MERIIINNGVYELLVNIDEYNDLMSKSKDEYFTYISSNERIVAIRRGEIKIERFPNFKTGVKICFNYYYVCDSLTSIEGIVRTSTIAFKMGSNEGILYSLNDSRIEIGKSVIDFKIDGNKLIVSINSNRETELKINKIVQGYLFLITGSLLIEDNHWIYTNEQEEEFSKFMIPIREEKLTLGFTRFSLIVEKSDFIETFKEFTHFYEDNLYPFEIFINTQLNIDTNVQQRVSILLNCIEGVVKKYLKKEKALANLDNTTKKIIKKRIKDRISKALEEDEFLLQGVDITDNNRVEILSRVNNAISKFDEFTFDEMLDSSKKISQSGFEFVKRSKFTPMFWKKCKDHRNFFAHLTEKKYKGFDGVQSVHAMYILSNYLRLIILEIINYRKIPTSNIHKEADSIVSWIEKEGFFERISNI